MLTFCLFPIERPPISPREHFYIFLCRTIGVTVISTAAIGTIPPTQKVPEIVIIMSLITDTDTMQYLWTILLNIATTKSVAIILLSSSQWLYQMVMPIGIHLGKKVRTSILKFLPQFGFIAAIPSTVIFIGSIFASKIRLRIIKKRGSSKGKYLAFQGQPSSSARFRQRPLNRYTPTADDCY